MHIQLDIYIDLIIKVNEVKVCRDNWRYVIIFRKRNMAVGKV